MNEIHFKDIIQMVRMWLLSMNANNLFGNKFALNCIEQCYLQELLQNTVRFSRNLQFGLHNNQFNHSAE